MAGFINTPVAPVGSYLGQVATLCRMPTQSLGAGFGTGTGWLMARTMHIAADRIVNPTVMFANWSVAAATNVETLYPGGTIKVAIEYPSGVFTLANECLAAGGPVAKNDGLTALTFGIVIPKGEAFWVRSLQQGPGTSLAFAAASPGQYAAGTGFYYGQNGPAGDQTMGGAVPDASGGLYQSVFPIAIVAQTSRPSFLLVGDSRTQGINPAEQVTDASADVGVLARLIGQRFGYVNLGVSGTQQAQYNSLSRTYRDELLPYVSHVINNYGINDLDAGGFTPAQLAANRAAGAAIWRAAGKTVVGTTISPQTSSTDNWATLANQTPNANVGPFNALVRAGIAGEQRVLDVADFGDPLRFGKFAVSRDPLGSAGAAQFGTQDGLHESAAYNMLVRDRGAGAVGLLG